MGIISKIISKIKGEEFLLDERIPLSYIINLSLDKFISLIWGVILFRKIVFISPRSKIKLTRKINVGKGSSIASAAYIDPLSINGITLGKSVSIQKHVSIECSGSVKSLGLGLTVDDNVGIGSNSFLGCAGGIDIGSNTIIGNFVSFHSESHNFQDKRIPIRLQGVNRKGIKVGENCWIGAKVTILDGANIGNNTIVAAGSVVTAGDYPDNTLLAGIPAVIKKKIYE